MVAIQSCSWRSLAHRISEGRSPESSWRSPDIYGQTNLSGCQLVDKDRSPRMRIWAPWVSWREMCGFVVKWIIEGDHWKVMWDIQIQCFSFPLGDNGMILKANLYRAVVWILAMKYLPTWIPQNLTNYKSTLVQLIYGQAITWTNVDSDLWRHKATMSKTQVTNFKMKMSYQYRNSVGKTVSRRFYLHNGIHITEIRWSKHRLNDDRSIDWMIIPSLHFSVSKIH